MKESELENLQDKWFWKGWVSCLIEQVETGVKPVAEYEGAAFWPGSWKDALDYIKSKSAEKGVKVSVEIEYETVTLKNGKVEIVEYHDGDFRRRTIAEPGVYAFKSAIIVLYKHEKDYTAYKKWLDESESEERHRALGKLFGYGEKETKGFLSRLEHDNHRDQT